MNTKTRAVVLPLLLAGALACGAGRICLAEKVQFGQTAASRAVYLAVYTLLPVIGCLAAGLAVGLLVRWCAGLSGHRGCLAVFLLLLALTLGALAWVWCATLMPVQKYQGLTNVLYTLTAYYPYWAGAVGLVGGLSAARGKPQGRRGR